MKIEADKTVRFFVSVIGIVAIAYVLKELSNIFIPLVIAYFLFFVFSPLNHFFKKRKIPLFLITLLDLAIILFTVWIISAFLIETFSRFGESLPSYTDKLNRLVSSAAVSLRIDDPFLRNFSVQEALSKIDYKTYAGGIFSSTFSLLGSVLFIVFFFVFVLSGHETIYEAIKRRFPVKKVNPSDNLFGEDKSPVNEERVTETFNKITDQIQKYIISKFLINLAAGFAGYIVLGWIGLDFPIIWGVFIFLFNFIPAIGSAVALILPVLMALVQFESTGIAVLILIIIILLQSVFFNVIEPMVIGRRLNLNPLLILISVLVWGYLWGIIGMLLAVPLTAIIKIILSTSDSENLGFLSDLMS